MSSGSTATYRSWSTPSSAASDLIDANDARALQAHNYHLASGLADEEAAMYREQRDRLVQALRAEGWSYSQLARVVGCSKSLIRLILREEARSA